jgi:hypothetical protein
VRKDEARQGEIKFIDKKQMDEEQARADAEKHAAILRCSLYRH